MTVQCANDRWGRPLVRIDVGGWEVGGRLPRGPDADEARVHLVSVATQTRRKFALEMGRPRHKTDQMDPGRRALDRLFCPFYSKQTGANMMGSHPGVGLSLKRSLHTGRHTSVQSLQAPASVGMHRQFDVDDDEDSVTTAG